MFLRIRMETPPKCHHPTTTTPRAFEGAWTMADSGSGEDEYMLSLEVVIGVGFTHILIVACLFVCFAFQKNVFVPFKWTAGILALVAVVLILVAALNRSFSDDSLPGGVYIAGLAVAWGFGLFLCWHYCFAGRPDGGMPGFKRIAEAPVKSSAERPLLSKVKVEPLFVQTKAPVP